MKLGVLVLALACALVAVLGLAQPARADLITNGDFESGNTGFSTDYRYAAVVNTAAGEYGIVTDPNPWNWGLASHGDHTSGLGNMMVVNGSGPSLTVWSQTVTITPSTHYEFAGWMISTHPTSPATLRLFVNGSQIGIDIPVPPNPGVYVPGTWTRFSAMWDSGVSTSAILKIIDLNPAASGNDFALDDLSFGEPSPVPEPATLALFGLGVGGLFLGIRRKRRGA